MWFGKASEKKIEPTDHALDRRSAFDNFNSGGVPLNEFLEDLGGKTLREAIDRGFVKEFVKRVEF